MSTQPTYQETLPPFDETAELSVLGALILDASQFRTVRELIAPEDFYRFTHKYIFQAIETILARQETPDLLLLRQELATRNQLEQVGGPAFLASLVDQVPTAANVTFHAGIVRELAKKRRLIQQCYQTQQALLENKRPFKEIYLELHEAFRSADYDPIDWVHTKHGQPQRIVERQYVKMIEGLGFRAVRYNSALTFGKIKNQIVQEVEWFKNTCFTLKQELKARFLVEFPTLWELLLREHRFDHRTLTSLQMIDQEDFLKDTADACHLPFQNGVVTIQPEQVMFQVYQDVGFFVWQDAICPYNYQGRYHPQCVLNLAEEQKSNRQSDFERFVRLVACQEIDGNFVDNKDAFEYGLGQLCWHHNDVLNQKAVVWIDEDPSYFSDGRRGKRIMLDALRFIRSNGTPDGVVIKEDGKAFGGTFKFQRVKPNTKILIIDDVDEETVSFKQFYSAVTDGLVKEGKGMLRFAFTPETSPKIAFTTNRPFFSVDRSSTDRLLILPMSDFFAREGNKPMQVFGRRLFYDWDAAEWARFHDYFIRIIQQAMKTDPLHAPQPDLSIFNANRLLLELPEILVNYFDTLEDELDYVKEEILAALAAVNIEFKKKGEFKKALETYCRLRDRVLYRNTTDGRYKRNSVEYIRFREDISVQS